MLIPAVAIGIEAGLTFLLSQAVARQESINVPIEGITRNSWLTFVKTSVNGNPRTITPNFRLGAFEMSVRRLADLGYMVGPKQVRYNGHSVWDADWVAPLSLRAYLADGLKQYETYAESVRLYADAPELLSLVDRTIDDKPATMSGLLAVAHRAGLHGLTTWASAREERERFNHTTEFFTRANGLF
jgi:hypothetical protein